MATALLVRAERIACGRVLDLEMDGIELVGLVEVVVVAGPLRGSWW